MKIFYDTDLLVSGDDFVRPRQQVLDSLAIGLETHPQLKILKPVVEPVAVDVMDVLIPPKWTPEMALHDQSVLQDPTTTTDNINAAYEAVSRRREPSAILIMRPPRLAGRSSARGRIDRSPAAHLLAARSAVTAAVGRFTRACRYHAVGPVRMVGPHSPVAGPRKASRVAICGPSTTACAVTHER